MASPFVADPASMPLHVLFPENYEASKREITRDFVLFGAGIVFAVVLSAVIGTSIA